MSPLDGTGFNFTHYQLETVLVAHVAWPVSIDGGMWGA